MAGVDITIFVEDLATQLAAGYDRINLERSNTVDGAYANVAFEPLVAGDYSYVINDATGDLNKWYRYRFEDNTGTPAGDYSDPFRVDAVTRLRIRQGILQKYGCGLVVAAITGSDLNTLKTDDYRIANSGLFRENHGKGLFTFCSAGTADNLTKARRIKTATLASGVWTGELEPDLPANIAAADEVELHHYDPKVLNDAINRGLARYWYVDRVPLPGVAGADEYSLEEMPWLHRIDQVHDVRHYPSGDTGIDESYGTNGKWYRIRKDAGHLVMSISPTVDSNFLFWLETTRPMPPLYTDTAAAPATCNDELAIALGYDEVLAWLSRPGKGAGVEREYWLKERLNHQPELKQLLFRHRPKPRYGPVQFPQPPVVPRPFMSR